MTTFGERLRELRKQNGLTQTEVGKLLGVGKTSVSGYELNDRDPDTKSLIKLAKYFNVTTDFLLGIDGTISIDNAIAGKLDKNFDTLSSIQKAHITSYIRFIIHENELSQRNNDIM